MSLLRSLDRHPAVELLEPVQDQVDAAGTRFVPHHQKALAVSADVVVGYRLRAAERVASLEEQMRLRNLQLGADGDIDADHLIAGAIEQFPSVLVPSGVRAATG